MDVITKSIALGHFLQISGASRGFRRLTRIGAVAAAAPTPCVSSFLPCVYCCSEHSRMSAILRTLLRAIPTRSHRSKLSTLRKKRRFCSSCMQRLEERVLLSTFTVTNTKDDGKPGSLRWAIDRVNAGNGKKIDTINF